eukprot:scaffold38091_cov29-Tisochrysis_lutea.AAC.2
MERAVSFVVTTVRTLEVSSWSCLEAGETETREEQGGSFARPKVSPPRARPCRLSTRRGPGQARGEGIRGPDATAPPHHRWDGADRQRCTGWSHRPNGID